MTETRQSSDAVVEATTLPELLARRAGDHPDRPWFRDTEGTAWTLGEFRARVLRLAAGLQGLGVGHGDRVAVVSANRPEYLEAWFAIAEIGAVFNPINAHFTTHEISFVVGDSGAKVVIGDASGVERVLADRSAFGAVEHVVSFDGAQGSEVTAFDDLRVDAEPTPVEIAGSDLASLVYTSGTTGRPKGAMLSHENYVVNAAQVGELLPLRHGDRAGLILPLFHANAQVATTMTSLMVGAEVLLWPPFSGRDFWKLVDEHRPTTFSSVPTILSALLHAPGADTADTSSLQYVVCGAAPLTRALLTRFEETFGLRVIEGYGLTESTCVSTVNPYWGPRKAGSIGMALRGQEIVITDDEGTVLPDGERGELRIKGANIMGGYWNRPDANAETLEDGWLRTGDVAYRDEDGFLYLVDRTKDMIIRGGENIYPREVEEAIAEHPAVKDVAVIGRPDAHRGEEVHAVVVLTEEVELSVLEAHTAERLASYKRPRTWDVITGDLPRTATGKTDKKALRAALADATETAGAR
ncbi:long-chain-fatty-acid--CoA ligase [Patulibacter brassicae]|jgi:acyl-CoA synthetase (AMP-forming)/AMP-acid ligase II|uniref:Long-chain-fatty-acid--CoA ligase n=1 Tax=Patulibacter brassicae TaxID=1705717 RepID=A0ABU4VH61_9ACTN|nr:long-chain-fatty-acid--CoA ligase [Patulibacter brassicae]MDX8150722.1 long-chain-fatty-acid--CoA ligase [Patulibacter brassicae]